MKSVSYLYVSQPGPAKSKFDLFVCLIWSMSLIVRMIYMEKNGKNAICPHRLRDHCNMKNWFCCPWQHLILQKLNNPYTWKLTVIPYKCIWTWKDMFILFYLRLNPCWSWISKIF
jgi:hypothetical protein